MFAKRLILLVATLFLLPMFVSCSEENNERKRSVVEFSAVGEGGAVFVAPWNAGTNKEFPDTDPDDRDDFRMAAYVPITLKNRAYSSYIAAPDYSPYGHFHVTELSVHWTSVQATTQDVQMLAALQSYDYTVNYDLVIPKDSEVTFQALLLPMGALAASPFQDLTSAYGGDGSTAPFIANAMITLKGHESGSEDLITLQGGVLAEFIAAIIPE